MVGVMPKDQDDTTQSPHNGSGAFDPLVQVRAYWEGLREGGTIPLRTEVSPRGIETALSSTFLIERVALGMARFRIAGMNLTDIMGMEARGMPISAFFTTEARPDLAKYLEQVFATPAVLSLTMTAIQELGRPTLSARLLALPLRDEKGRINLALGCIALTGNIGRSPRRFDIGDAAVTALAQPAMKHPFAVAPTKHFTPQVVSTTGHAFAEPTPPFDHSGRGKPKPYLRLVE